MYGMKLCWKKLREPETDNLGKGLRQMTETKSARNDLLIQSCWLPGYHKAVAKSVKSIQNKNCNWQSFILLDQMKWLQDYLSLEWLVIFSVSKNIQSFQGMCYLEILLHLTHGVLKGIWTHFHQLPSSLSRNNLTFVTGASAMLFLPVGLTIPIFNLTLCTNPLSSQNVCMTLHICQSFLMVFASCKIMMSPTFMKD